MKYLLLHKFIIISSIILFHSLSMADTGENSLFYYEMNMFQGFSEREGFFGRGNDSSKSIGIENFRKFSGDYGDWLTTDIQLRLAYNSDNPLSEDRIGTGDPERDALDIEIHNAYGRFKLLYGKADIWVGHYEAAFGQEPQLDTYPTILQTINMKNIGFKKDWGAGIRGVFTGWDYHLTATLGSGMGMHFKGNYLLSGRIGFGETALTDYNFGLSILYGDVVNTTGGRKLSSDNLIVKKRIGIDATYFYRSFDIKGEIDYGTDNDKSALQAHDVFGTWLQVSYVLPEYQKLHIEVQQENWFYEFSQRERYDSAITAGFSYKLNGAIYLRFYGVRDLHLISGNLDNRIMVQYYYYYPTAGRLFDFKPE
ncbi:MAG: hypothetical protein AABZ28_05350 [Nitrospinota bacterium]